jgi:hypothetical protein
LNYPHHVFLSHEELAKALIHHRHLSLSYEEVARALDQY